MDGDATLGDFLDSNDGSTTEDGRGTAADAPAVDPARTTYAYTPEGRPCEECGAAVQRRWEQDGTLVCEACKEW